MAVSIKTSGTQAIAALNTDYVLATITDAGVYQFQIDTSPLVVGESLEIKMYSKMTSGDTERLYHSASVVGGQIAPILIFEPILSDVHLKIAIRQTAGSLRTLKWKVLQP